MNSRNLWYIIGALLMAAILVYFLARLGLPDGGNNSGGTSTATSSTTTSGQTVRVVRLYYPNTIRAQEIGDPCSPSSLRPVVRQIPRTQSPVADTVRLLIRGELNSAERQAGFTTEFPNPQFRLVGANLNNNGLLTLEFTAVPGFTTGGSCRVALLTAQIRQTALQFPAVREVRFLPEEIFQP